MKKRIIIGIIVAASYIFFCRFIRGYWALDGDMIVISMTAVAYLLLCKGVKNDAGKDVVVTSESLFKRKIPVCRSNASTLRNEP